MQQTLISIYEQALKRTDQQETVKENNRNRHILVFSFLVLLSWILGIITSKLGSKISAMNSQEILTII